METNLEEAKKSKIREQVGILLVCLVLAGSGVLLLKEKPESGTMSFSSGNGKVLEANSNASTKSSANSSAAEPAISTKININTASLEDLDKLPGVGPATAQKIIDYRNQNGLFPSIEAIDGVSGIGPSKYSQMKDMISI